MELQELTDQLTVASDSFDEVWTQYGIAVGAAECLASGITVPRGYCQAEFLASLQRSDLLLRFKGEPWFENVIAGRDVLTMAANSKFDKVETFINQGKGQVRKGFLQLKKP